MLKLWPQERTPNLFLSKWHLSFFHVFSYDLFNFPDKIGFSFRRQMKPCDRVFCFFLDPGYQQVIIIITLAVIIPEDIDYLGLETFQNVPCLFFA